MYSNMKEIFTSRYEKVNQTITDSETGGFAADGLQKRDRLNPWMISTVVLGILSVVLYLKSWTGATLGSYHEGFVTDFAPATTSIVVEKTRFTGGIGFNLNGTAYRNPSPDGIDFVGAPSAAIDDAWSNILQEYHFAVTEEEQRDSFGDSYVEYFERPRVGYINGLAMFHSLHCMNMIRMILDKSYYEVKLASLMHLEGRPHIDHCLDYLRQMIQCSGDLTPIPTRWWAEAKRDYSDSDNEHTCRNFDSIRKWVTRRADEFPSGEHGSA